MQEHAVNKSKREQLLSAPKVAAVHVMNGLAAAAGIARRSARYVRRHLLMALVSLLILVSFYYFVQLSVFLFVWLWSVAPILLVLLLVLVLYCVIRTVIVVFQGFKLWGHVKNSPEMNEWRDEWREFRAESRRDKIRPVK